MVNISSLSVVSSLHPDDDVATAAARLAATRDATKLFASIDGDLTGEVVVGEVWRFDAPGIVQGSTLQGGNLMGLLRATNNSPVVFGDLGGGDTSAVKYVRFGKSLTGSIFADNSGIARVFIGDQDNPGFIQGSFEHGSIEAPNGVIGAIVCAGGIGVDATGALSPPAIITAGDSIRQIRTTLLDVDNNLAQSPINATIRSGEMYTRTDNPVALPAGFDHAQLGSLGLLEAGGDLSGTIDALNVGGRRNINFSDLPPVGRDNRTGITVRGKISAPIHIKGNLWLSDIIGSAITSEIVIGNQAKGSIVAYGDPSVDSSLGAILSVKIGLAADSDVPGTLRTTYPPGFVGTDAQPLSLAPEKLDDTGTGRVARTREDIWFDTSVTQQDNGAKDSVIHADSIGWLEISRTSQEFGGGAPIKDYRPRIEARFIKDLLIGEMVAGVIWSGNLNYSDSVDLAVAFPFGGPQAVANNSGDDYTQLENVTIGCVSPAADIYMNSSFLSFNVTTDLLGELHLPSLDAGRTLFIGGRLGAQADGASTGTGCSLNSSWATFTGNEISPRGHDRRIAFNGGSFTQLDNEPDFAPTGAIRFADPLGLHGQIIIHGDAAPGVPQNPAEYLKGLVWLGDGLTSPAPRIMGHAVFTDPLLQLPLYAAKPAALGGAGNGGAVGLAPFALHKQACSPVQSTFPGPRIGLDPLRDGISTIDLVHYGPVYSFAGSPVTALYREFGTFTDPALDENWTVRNDMFDTTVNGRTITLTGRPEVEMGNFRIVSSNTLVCSTPTGQPVTPYTSTSGLHFFTSCTVGGRVNPADVNGDGIVDGSDFTIFINSFAAGDPTTDAAADVAGDYANPFYPTASGGPDGIIDGNDFTAFINAFAAGGC